MRQITYREAIHEVLDYELETNLISALSIPPRNVIIF
jgi:hypothetical protein